MTPARRLIFEVDERPDRRWHRTPTGASSRSRSVDARRLEIPHVHAAQPYRRASPCDDISTPIATARTCPDQADRVHAQAPDLEHASPRKWPSTVHERMMRIGIGCGSAFLARRDCRAVGHASTVKHCHGRSPFTIARSSSLRASTGDTRPEGHPAAAGGRFLRRSRPSTVGTISATSRPVVYARRRRASCAWPTGDDVRSRRRAAPASPDPCARSSGGSCVRNAWCAIARSTRTRSSARMSSLTAPTAQTRPQAAINVARAETTVQPVSDSGAQADRLSRGAGSR